MLNPEAIKCYQKAQILGNRKREQAIEWVNKGIDCFPSLADAIKDAEDSIARYTKSDLPLAHFYEVVKAKALRREALRRMEGANVESTGCNMASRKGTGRN